jgi:hypothetical protein
MAIKRQIAEVQGVQDEKAANILRDLKAVVDETTGRSPKKIPIKLLGAAATLPGVINKINEIINRLQGDA